jgi:tripartite-type tricarboxylate transporter receptor subunit TctC
MHTYPPETQVLKPLATSLSTPFARSLAAAATTAIVCIGAVAAAEPYPSRPVTLVVPFPAGGTTDVIARSVAQSLSRLLGKTVIVDNKAGAAGTLGATQVARAQPDGYTLLMGGPADQVSAPFLMSKPPYDPGRDFEPVGCVLRAPNVLVVTPKLPARSVAELVQLAKKEPGKLNYGSAGNGNTSHLLGELFAQTTGTELTHVPYRGNAPAVNDTMAGQVQMMFANPVSIVQQVKTGALRAVAVTSKARIAALPDVPTLRESGVAVENYSWSCLMAPAKTPGDVLERLQTALTRALDDPEVQKTIQSTGGEKFPTSREEARRFLAAERSTWGTLIRARKITAD